MSQTSQIVAIHEIRCYIGMLLCSDERCRVRSVPFIIMQANTASISQPIQKPFSAAVQHLLSSFIRDYLVLAGALLLSAQARGSVPLGQSLGVGYDPQHLLLYVVMALILGVILGGTHLLKNLINVGSGREWPFVPFLAAALLT